jgi:hypothetical protein
MEPLDSLDQLTLFLILLIVFFLGGNNGWQLGESFNDHEVLMLVLILDEDATYIFSSL